MFYNVLKAIKHEWVSKYPKDRASWLREETPPWDPINVIYVLSWLLFSAISNPGTRDF